MEQESRARVSLKVMCLEDSPRDTEIIRDLLTEAGYDLTMDCTVDKSEFVSLLRSQTYDVILSDFKCPGFDAFEALRLSIDICPHVPFICVSGAVGEDTAIELMKQGVVDYVLKDRIARLPSAIKRASDDLKEQQARKKMEETLRESEERYRTLVTFSPDALFVHVDDRLTLVNPAFCQLLGAADQSQLIGRSVLELVPPQYQDKVRERWNLIPGGQPAPLHEGQFIRLDGTLVDVEVRGVAIDWRGTNGVQVIARDITDRKKAEETLSASEARYRRLFEAARDGILILDADTGMVVDVNPFLAEMLGYSREQFLGKRIWELGFFKDVAASKSNFAELQRKGFIQFENLPLKTARGQLINVEFVSHVYQVDHNKVIQCNIRDITERKKAGEHLRQSEEQFRLIAENVADMIAVLDLNGRRIYNSPAYKSILGDPESLKGTDSFREIHSEDRDRVKQVFQETIRTGVGQRIEYQLMRKDGSIRNVDSKGSVIRDSDGKLSQVIVVSRDVTEEKMLAAQFLRAQRMESIGTLAGGIAHDLNNVLAPIMMAIEVLRSKMADQGGQRILNTIEISAKRGADIVRQVLAFGRGVQGDRILVQLKHVAIEVAKIAGETFPKSIEITTDFPRDLWTVSADPTQMHQVLLNVLVNARDAMPKGGTLTISAENVKLDENYARMHADAKPGEYVSIAVSDTGTGIPEDIREKIFEPFFTTKEIGTGTGLGLSTTLAIVKSHDGFINLYSEVGKGSTFRIYIPATGTASHVPVPGGEPDLPTGNGELILVIDDEAAIREITRETLEAYGYKAVTASDGAEGVAAFAAGKKDIKVVITDIMMPVMDGTAAILALMKINPDVKIIAASGLTARVQVEAPPDPHVQAFLTKPYTAEKLLKALAAVLR
jgi:PAS domain S-box-containing protein